MGNNIFFKTLSNSLNQEINDDNLDYINNEIMNSLLKYASETPDNLNCFNHIEYRKSKYYCGGGYYCDCYTFKIKDKDIKISDILYRIEEIFTDNIPDELKSSFNLSQEEWDAFFRFIFLILNSLKYNKKKL